MASSDIVFISFAGQLLAWRAVSARIVIIGGGSAYMPGIAFGLVHAHDTFADATLVLQDIDGEAMHLQRRLTQGILRSRGAGEVRVEAQSDRLRAIEGADVVLAAFRPGGFAARHLDERIAIDHGIVGQETAGPGGFAMALRSVPIVVDIAEEVRRVAAPGAWLLDYTNPVQVVSEAMARFGPDVPFLGLCDQTSGEEAFIAELLGADAGDVELDTCGTNHMTFTRAVRVRDRDVTDELWSVLDGLDLEALATDERRHIVRLFRMLRRIPSEYLQYFFFHDAVLAKQRAAGRTRAEEIMATLPDVLASYRREADAEHPSPSMARASEGHGDFAMRIATTLLLGARHRFILNLPNEGQVQDLPAGVIVETPALIEDGRVVPIPQGSLPFEVSGLVRQVAAHAALTAEAALTGDRALAVKALTVHPLVRSPDRAASLVGAYLVAHAASLPRFRSS
jgi:6-phospho-beta-glucosidase